MTKPMKGDFMMMEKANQHLRDELRSKNIQHWQVAETIGIDASTLVRWLRVPLTPDHAERIRVAVDKITEIREVMKN